MKLYVVYSKKNTKYSKKYIVGQGITDVIRKYLEVCKDDSYYLNEIQADFLCDRDEIIPCTDPIEEFKN